jgi:hypothetical protein
MHARLASLAAGVLAFAAAVAPGSTCASDQRAQTNFMLHCSGCHQSDGSGSVRNGIPNMRDRVGHFLRLPEGRDFLVQVPGTSQSPMNDTATAELLNWMVRAYSAAEIPQGFVPYTAAEVTRLRAHPLDDAPGTRAAIAQRLRGMGLEVD